LFINAGSKAHHKSSLLTTVGKLQSGESTSLKGNLMNTFESSVGKVQPRLISVEEAGAIIGVKKTMAYKLVNTGKLRPVRVGRTLKVSISEIDRFIQQAQMEFRFDG
jgi:excisionase family DNA binding protein